MKILFVNTVGFTRNGISTMVMNLSEQMSYDPNVTVSVVSNGPYATDYLSYLDDLGIPAYVLNRSQKHIIKYIRSLRKIIRDNKIDVLYVHGNSATMLFDVLATLGTKTIRVIHTHNEATDHPFITKLLTPFLRKIYNIGYSVNDVSGEKLFGKKEYRVVKNGVFLDRYDVNQDEVQRIQQLNKKDNEPLLVQVGTFSEQKNYEFTIRMLSNLRDKRVAFKALLIGEGPLIKEIQQMAKEHRLENNVTFLQPQPNIQNYLAASDAVLFPSLFEPFGLVALEAQLVGSRVLVSDAFTKSLELSSNISFLQLDEKVWSEKISNIINDRLNQFELVDGGNVREEAKEKGFDIRDVTVEILEEFLENVDEK
ncbi:glycosyltransferase [Weissella confusa]|uniref:Glycosyltransferase family 1 protein n=1 Tax=Weissella confusa TaxID=1583 RepID=A0A4Z0RXT6_WEICO|nr:glycosyltransferase [Weissella confusa]TGE71789.1 hypothetical protein C6P11_07780 [Weissella confusa]